MAVTTTNVATISLNGASAHMLLKSGSHRCCSVVIGRRDSHRGTVYSLVDGPGLLMGTVHHSTYWPVYICTVVHAGQAEADPDLLCDRPVAGRWWLGRNEGMIE